MGIAPEAFIWFPGAVNPKAIFLTDSDPGDCPLVIGVSRGTEDDAFFDPVLEETEFDLLRMRSVNREVVQGVQYQGVQGLRPRFW